MVIGFGQIAAAARARRATCRARPSCSTPLTTGWPLRIASVSPGPATIRLMKFWLDRSAVGFGQGWRRECGSPHSVPLVGARRRMEDDDVADRGIGEVVEEAVDEDPLADVEGRLHRFGGDLVRLDQPGLDAERQAERQRHDDDELDQPAGAALRLRDAAVSVRVLAGVAVLVGRLLILRRRRRPRSPRLRLLGLRRLGSASAAGGSASPSQRAVASSASALRRLVLGGLLGVGLDGLPRPRPRSRLTPSASSASGSSALRPPAPRSAPRRSPAPLGDPGGLADPPAGSRASPGARRRARRSRVSRSSASAAGTSARRRRRRTACGR